MQKRNILFIESGYGFGGATICLAALLKGLDKNKYNPIVIFSQKDEASRNLLQNDEWLSLFVHKYHRSKFTNTLIIKSAKLGRFVKQIILICTIFTETVLTIPFFIKVMKVVKKNEIDLIHINNYFNANGEAVVISQLLKVPCIAHVRGELYNSIVARYIAKHITRFIAVSGFIKQGLDKFGVAAQKVRVVYDGIDMSALDQKRRDITTDQMNKYSFGIHNVGIFSCLVWWKGHQVFIKAIDILVKERKITDCKFFIVGDTDDMNTHLKRELLNTVSNLKLEDYIVFTGHRANVYPFMDKMDIVVHTSTMPEPFGMVIIEAMALGKPVIATKMGGPLEMINDQFDGILIPPGDPRILAETIFSLLNDENKRRQMSIRAKEIARRKFDINNHVKNIENIYEEVLR